MPYVNVFGTPSLSPPNMQGYNENLYQNLTATETYPFYMVPINSVGGMPLSGAAVSALASVLTPSSDGGGGGGGFDSQGASTVGGDGSSTGDRSGQSSGDGTSSNPMTGCDRNPNSGFCPPTYPPPSLLGCGFCSCSACPECCDGIGLGGLDGADVIGANFAS